MGTTSIFSRAIALSASLWIFSSAGLAEEAPSAQVTLSAVNNVTPGQADLQEAIRLGGVVRLSFDGTITLTNTVEITNDVVLDAQGHSVTISGNNAVRLFHVNSGVDFSATNVIFANGHHAGANGDGDQPGLVGQGGAILSEGGAVQLISCMLTNNSATGGTGGPVSTNATGEGRGGAIAVLGGSLLLDSVTLFSNSASGGVGTPQPVGFPPGYTMPDTSGRALGGAVYSTNASVQFFNCVITNNLCKAPGGGHGTTAHGGAIFLASGNLMLSNSWINGNTAWGGDALAPTGYLATVYGAASSGYGGALAADSGTVTLERCQINLNRARGGETLGNASGFVSGEAQGGAVFSTAVVVASDSGFSQNSATAGSGATTESEGRGGAFYSMGSAALTGCLFVSNSATGGSGGGNANRPGGASGLGGAIFNLSQLTMTNCTVAANHAKGGGSSYFTKPPGSAIGGGIYNTNGNLTAVDLTVASNCVTAGAMGTPMTRGFSAGANIANASGTLALQNSILAYPIKYLLTYDPGTSSSNAWGTIADAGNNISSDSTANFTSSSSLSATDPRLLPLADNGGSTWTMALATNSPAIDAGTSVGAPATDQRGLPRLMGKGYDIGAFELQSTPTSIPMAALTKQPAGLHMSFHGQRGMTYSVRFSTDLINWTEVDRIGPFERDMPMDYTLEINSQPKGFYRLFVP